MKIFVIKSHFSTRLNYCIEAIHRTSKEILIEIVPELNTREETLNSILSQKFEDDILIMADDIIVGENWLEDIIRFNRPNRVMGLCMKHPETSKIQNKGFDLIKIGSSISTRKRLSKNFQETEKKTFVKCFSFTGCFMFIPQQVLEYQILVPLEGKNRLGEILYHFLLHEKNIEIGIIDNSFVSHYADSTKNNPNKSLENQSYLYEKEIWDAATQKFNLEKYVDTFFEISISSNLQKFLTRNKPLFFGAGSVVSQIIEKLDIKNFDICSGFKSEDGQGFYNQKINYFNNLNFPNYRSIVITVIGAEEEIKKYIQQYSNTIQIYCIKEIRTKSKLEYSIEKL